MYECETWSFMLGEEQGAEGKTWDWRNPRYEAHHNLYSYQILDQTKDDDEMMDGHADHVSGHKRTLNVRRKA